MENKRLYKQGDNLVIVAKNPVTGEEEVLDKGPVSLMLSRPDVREILLGTVKEEPQQEEVKEEKVDVNEVIDNVIKQDEEEKESETNYEEVNNDEESLEDEYEDDLDNVPVDDEYDDEYVIVNETPVDEEKKSNLKKKILLGLGVAGVLAALALAGKSCGTENLKANVSTVVETVQDDNENTNDEPENTTDTPDNTVDEPENTTASVEEPVVEEPVVQEKTLEELYADSRYTEITEENLTKATNDLVTEFSKHGIEVNGQDALYFVALNNITHISQTNPELLSQIFGEVDKETVLAKAGHIIGQIVTLEVTNKDEQVDWTVSLIDGADKKIADHDMKLIEDCKAIATNEDLTKEEKTEQIRGLVQDKFVKPNYDKTIGRDFEDGTHSAISQEDGADFTTDAIFTGIMMGDNLLKDYINKSETTDDLLAISGNEDVVPNLFTIIDDCKGKSF